MEAVTAGADIPAGTRAEDMSVTSADTSAEAMSVALTSEEQDTSAVNILAGVRTSAAVTAEWFMGASVMER